MDSFPLATTFLQQNRIHKWFDTQKKGQVKNPFADPRKQLYISSSKSLMPQQLQDIGAMKGTKDTPSHSKKNSCEQWDLSNSWLKACDVLGFVRQITFSKDFSFKKSFDS